MATQTATALEQPVSQGGIRSVNFFNGRLLTGADLSREQQANRQALSRLGLAIGSGVAFGLEVSESALSNNQAPTVKIKKGLAVNPLGQTLSLDADIDIALTRRFQIEVQTEKKDFRECKPLQTGSYIVSAGVYLLTIAPATEKVGKAQTSSLEPGIIKCNTDEIVEGVKFRLVQMPLPIDEDFLKKTDKLRNFVAYSCFGTMELNLAAVNPFGAVPMLYGLIDAMRLSKHISDCEVPLAVIGWTLNEGITFIDIWAARRRVTRSNENGRWSFLLSDRRLSEAEAMLSQFEDHLLSISSRSGQLNNIFDTEPFTFLPAAGMIPIGVGGLPETFNLQNIFSGRATDEIASLDLANFRCLLQESFSHDPIDLREEEKVQLYLLRENVIAYANGMIQQQVIIFAKHTLTYRGRARFDEASWDLNRFTPNLI